MDDKPTPSDYRDMMDKMLQPDDVPALTMTREERRRIARKKRVRKALYSTLLT